MTEYSLALALVAIVCVVIVRGLGEQTSVKYDDIAASIAAGGPGGCWVAAELFGGWYAPKTVAARYYVNYIGPDWFKDFYLRNGENFSKFLHSHPSVKPVVQPLFEYFAREGSKALNNVS